MDPVTGPLSFLMYRASLRGVGSRQCSILVVNVPPVGFVGSGRLSGGDVITLESGFRGNIVFTGNRVITIFCSFGTRSELLCPWSCPMLSPISS